MKIEYLGDVITYGVILQFLYESRIERLYALKKNLGTGR